MRVRIEYEEHTRRMVDVEVPTVEMAEAFWRQHDSDVVDQWIEQSTEIDGGELWETATFTVIG